MIDPNRLSDHRWDQLALAAVALGVVIRAVWVFGVHPPLDYIYSDMRGYVERATRTIGGSWDRSLALKAPGTHLVLAAPMLLLGTARAGLWGAAALWWALSSLAPFLAWRVARRLLGPAAAAVTALLCALYPLHISYAGYFSSETPSLTLLLAAILLGLRITSEDTVPSARVCLFLGLLMGVVTVVRPPMVFNLVVVVAPLLRRLRRNLAPLATIALGGVLVLTPVLAMNARAAGEFVGMSDYDGLNFFLGQCPAQRVRAGPTYAPGSPVHIQLGRGENYSFPDHPAGDKGFYFEQGLACIRRHGTAHITHTLLNIRDMTSSTVPWPQVHDPQVKPLVTFTNRAYSAILPVLVVGTALWIVRARRVHVRSGRGILLWHLACLLPTAILFFGDPRYRAPYDVFGLMLGAALLMQGTKPAATTADEPPVAVAVDA